MSAVDRGRAEKVLYRTAISAFMYYPDKPDNEPGYDVEEDVAWCVAPLERQLPMPDVEMVRGVIRMLITDPLADRRPLIQKLAELSGESESDPSWRPIVAPSAALRSGPAAYPPSLRSVR